MRILLVEDHAAVADISCSLLREVHEHEVAHVGTGAAALAAIDKFRPDLVLLDLNLPDTSGYEVARQLRRAPRYDETLLVALTGFGNDVDPVRAREVGFDAHFRKPMDFAVLPSITRGARPA